MSRALGDEFELHALHFLQRQRLRLVARNVTYRGCELDLIMRELDGTLVFIEVRARGSSRFGGAGGSVDEAKCMRIASGAKQFLAGFLRCGGEEPPCRFDVIAFEHSRLVWYRDAFSISNS